MTFWKGWSAPATFSGMPPQGRLRQCARRQLGQGMEKENLLQDLKLPGTLILVVQGIHGVVGEFPGACGVLEF